MEHYPEFPNILTLLAEAFATASWAPFLRTWQDVIYAALAGSSLVALSWAGSRRLREIPSGLHNALEMYVEGTRSFVCGILGPKGEEFVPFIGTLFLYILTLNLMGFIPFLKSPSTNLSTTVALAICVFVYVQYASFKELGVRGYLDHLMGKPRGMLAWTIIMPFFMLILHTISELIRPVTLSLRLRSVIWGDDLLLAIFAGYGLLGLPLLFVNFAMSLLTAIIQAFVFTVLTTVYFALVVVPEE